MKYIEQHEHLSGCIFCMALEQEDTPQNLILYRGITTFTILNRYPYTSGHLMIVPYAHQASLELLDPPTRAEIMELTTIALRVLREAYKPEAFNIGANIGTAAGAGIAAHFHIHVVPRWGGDTNFMSTLADTRVLPETLEDSYWRLTRIWESISADHA